MADVIITPPEAVDAGCTAAAVITATETITGEGWTATVDRFRFSAEMPRGWWLTKWVAVSHVVDTFYEGEQTEFDEEKEVQGNPYDESGLYVTNCVQYSFQYTGSQRARVKRLTSVTAFFADRTANLRVITIAVPPEAGANGCTALVNGSNRLDVTGASGDPVQFTLAASAPQGWRFLRWKLNGLPVSRDAERVVNSTIFDGTDTYTASFIEDDGRILCDEGGNILTAFDGAVLCRG